MRQNINFGKLLHGGDYNPEQWLEYPEILEQDLAYFKKAKINEVSLGIFSWAFLEPEEGVFDLEWLKKMVDRLYENGISVMMATPTAARPRWMAQKYPEVLRMDAMRQRNLYGERHNLAGVPGKNEKDQYKTGRSVQGSSRCHCMAYFE